MGFAESSSPNRWQPSQRRASRCRSPGQRSGSAGVGEAGATTGGHVSQLDTFVAALPGLLDRAREACWAMRHFLADDDLRRPSRSASSTSPTSSRTNRSGTRSFRAAKRGRVVRCRPAHPGLLRRGDRRTRWLPDDRRSTAGWASVSGNPSRTPPDPGAGSARRSSGAHSAKIDSKRWRPTPEFRSSTR